MPLWSRSVEPATRRRLRDFFQRILVPIRKRLAELAARGIQVHYNATRIVTLTKSGDLIDDSLISPLLPAGFRVYRGREPRTEDPAASGVVNVERRG